MAPAPETAPSTDSSTPSPPPANASTTPDPATDSASPPPPADSSPPPPPPPAQSPPPPPPAETPPPPSPAESPPPPPPKESPPPPASTPPPPAPTPPPASTPSSSSSPPPPATQSPPPAPLASNSSSSSSQPPPPPPPSPSLPSPSGHSPPSPPISKSSNSPPPPPSVPSPKGLAPPTKSSSSASDDLKTPSANGHSETNLPLVIGVSLGVGLFMALMIVALVSCTRKKKKPFYYENAAPRGEAAGALPKWQNGGMEHMGKIPPPPGAPAGSWGQMPAGMYSSGEMSSGAFSGPGAGHGSALPPPSPAGALGFNKGTFAYDELVAATSGFSQANLLGQGGFGYVFKGVLPNGKEVAVKQLKAGSGQGEKEFQAEVEIISRVHHRHLVSLVGYCITGQHRLLVYEFVPNKTLEHHLHGNGLPTMDWPTRLKIALGSAKGLAYLHEDCHPRIIHRDIKAANILIDYKFEAMVADFGLAKLSEDTNTHVSTRVMGTFGYLAPEYAASGKLTEKSDVFSFGVMLLELITGRRPIDHSHLEDDSLVDWARPLLTQALSDDNFEEIVDPSLENNYNTVEMARMIACAAASTRHSAKRRPRMSQIVRALEGDVVLEDLNEGVKPGQSVFFSSGSDGEYGSYNARMRQFRKVALGTDDYSNTSEYGLNPSESSSSSGEVSSTIGSTRVKSPTDNI